MVVSEVNDSISLSEISLNHSFMCAFDQILQRMSCARGIHVKSHALGPPALMEHRGARGKQAKNHVGKLQMVMSTAGKSREYYE